MKYKWNSPSKSIGPTAYFGISETKEIDDFGMKIYAISQAAASLSSQLGFK